MRYYLRVRDQGSFTNSDYDAWKKLAVTPYSELTEAQRHSDREVATTILLPAIQPLLDRLEAAEQRVKELEGKLNTFFRDTEDIFRKYAERRGEESP
jgi:hypothetical protein